MFTNKLLKNQLKKLQTKIDHPLINKPSIYSILNINKHKLEHMIKKQYPIINEAICPINKLKINKYKFAQIKPYKTQKRQYHSVCVSSFPPPSENDNKAGIATFVIGVILAGAYVDTPSYIVGAVFGLMMLSALVAVFFEFILILLGASAICWLINYIVDLIRDKKDDN